MQMANKQKNTQPHLSLGKYKLKQQCNTTIYLQVAKNKIKLTIPIASEAVTQQELILNHCW